MGEAMTIRSRITERGNPLESAWPSDYGTRERGVFHVDKDSGKVKEGYPEPEFQKLGEAPTVIFDSMPEEYHHGVCRPISSRKEWEAADKESGSATISPNEWKAKKERIPKLQRAKEREMAKDRRRASVEALRSARENPVEFEQRMQKTAEIQEESAAKNGLTKLIKEKI